MGYPATGSVARQIGALFEGGSAAGLSDRQLLERFNDRRDDAEAAFAALVSRHGPMVLSVCRRFLDDHHLAEDAFQAVFLVLARRAANVRDPDLLGNWLYGVALRTAHCARSRLARRRRAEEDGTAMCPDTTVPPADEAVAARERAEALHAEIERLPAAFRRPVVLCYLEGLTVHEAALRLRCSHGTVRSRIARGREKLRVALTRRGVVLSTAAMAAALDARPASAAVSSLLCDSTARAALAFAARRAISGALAAPLAREVLRSMLIHRLRFTALTAILLGAVGAGMSVLGAPAGPREGEPRIQQAARAEPRPPDPTRPAPGRMFVVGRVLDPAGRPVPGATVAVSMRRKLLFAEMDSEAGLPAPAGDGACDASGRFWLDAARSSSGQHSEFGATAIAPGYGLGWTDLDPDEDRPSADIRLQPEQVVEGRLFDLQGRPAAGVVVSVWSIQRELPPMALGQDRFLERSEGVTRWWGRVHDGPGWPRPTTTDAEGRFTLHGLGRGLRASLSILDPRFAPQTIDVDSSDPAGARAFKAVLQPARTLTGRVTYADTGRPIAGARVTVSVAVGQLRSRALGITTDAEGRFRVSPMPGDRIRITARAPEGEPYFAGGTTVPWPKGAVEQSVALPLHRGVRLRGKVVEEGTGRPVPDAMVSFNPHPDLNAGRGHGLTGADGSFGFAVEPHSGHLSVQAPGEDYQLQVIGNRELYQGQKGGLRLYAHAFLPHDARPEAGAHDVQVALRRGATVEFRLIGPDGQPVPDVWVYSRAVLGPKSNSALRSWQGINHEVARHGRFRIHGLDPEAEVPVYLLQPDRKLGATVKISGKMAEQGPITVRLEPCGQVMARLVGPDGRPVTGRPDGVSVEMVLTPGPPRGSLAVRNGALAADEAPLNRVDPVNHRGALTADAQGRVSLPALIPGATYRVVVRGARAGDDVQIPREFVAGPGEAVELGDVVVPKPAG